ncbi:RagB/SusD family nutrient uptake outer membrane protein [Dyadobacter aurulentus]|uniref:RagB/SusD family nutrient uptake outer membrane protein n=1 Tax=Dyadobacter sp. UC 10 TaxID=2605428 RepID=UPI0011F12E1E|nr:RagB/SusD family nutrient uptake outer membrane protein [Dyadobacter sp. UC 10]KAA0992748.1 RagB/SusD family nutrient uptake outer membrane protein [Dyadobacter sp. UC 10]
MRQIIKYICVFVATFSLVSCGDSFLTLKPQDILTDANFFLTESDAQAALTGIYAILQREETFSNVRDAADIEWAMAGDMYEMDGSANRIELHSLSLPSNNTILRDVYSGAYQGVGRANIVINRVGKMENLDPAVKAGIIAQAKFLRSLFYYRLVSYWGGVPLITEELNASSNLEIPRSSAAEVWALIEADLKEAAAVLPATWNDANKGRVTKTAALGYLVKAALWQQKWTDAVKYSEEILATNAHDLLPKFRDVFRETNENNKELLFSTQFRTSVDAEGNNLVKRTAPRGAPAAYTGSAAWSNFVPQKHWVNAFEKDPSGKIKDSRYWDVIIGPGEAHQDISAFVMPANVPAGWSRTGYIVTKYWEAPALTNSGVNTPILRFAEVLLNYAEALNETGQPQKAMELVNRIRSRAGLTAKPLTLSKEAVLDAIFYERRMEFIWEPVGAFSDLNRRGRFVSFVKANRPNVAELEIDKKPWLSTVPILFPIPREAWDKNKALEQNPHYTF